MSDRQAEADKIVMDFVLETFGDKGFKVREICHALVDIACFLVYNAAHQSKETKKVVYTNIEQSLKNLVQHIEDRIEEKEILLNELQETDEKANA